MNEEMSYGINVKGLPVVVVYPELTIDENLDVDGNISERVKKLWDAAPVFRDNKWKVYTQHIPFEKIAIHEAIGNIDKLIKIE